MAQHKAHTEESARHTYLAALAWERLVRGTRVSNEADIRRAIDASDVAREVYRSVGGFDS